MSRTASVLVRIDRTVNTVTLIVTGDPTLTDRHEVTRMVERARALFPGTTVTVDLDSVGSPGTQDSEWENTDHLGGSGPEISSTPAVPIPRTGPSGR